jgi:hypothetical protein
VLKYLQSAKHKGMQATNGIYGVQSSNINKIKNTGVPKLHIPKVFLMGRNITNLKKQFSHLKKSVMVYLHKWLCTARHSYTGSFLTLLTGSQL